MYSTLLLAIVAGSVLISLQNWRVGLLCCLIVGVLQDPVRKITPNTPIYLTLAFVPIYVAMFVNLWTRGLSYRSSSTTTQMPRGSLCLYCCRLPSAVCKRCRSG